MSRANNLNAAIIDASVLVSIAAKETATHLVVENAFKIYSQNGWEFFAPNLIVPEVIFALCQKFAAAILTEAEYEKAIATFLDYMTIISTPDDERIW